VFDEIVTHDRRRIESFGGIIYNLAALSSLVGGNATIRPCTNIGADRYEAVMSILRGMPQIVREGIARADGPLTHAQLVYTDANHRDEIVRHMMKPLTFDEVQGELSSAGILINFVNGTEIDLATLRKVRAGTDATLYLDMHNIMVRFDDEGRKHYPGFASWPDWVSQFDLVQMNEFECEAVLGCSLEAPRDYLDAAHRVLEAGPSAVFVTMGPEGVALAHRREGIDYGCLIPPAQVHGFVDATGCGDAFSAGTFWNYLRTGDPLVAAMSGALVGAANCRIKGLGRLEGARDAANRLHEISPELADKALQGWPGDRL